MKYFCLFLCFSMFLLNFAVIKTDYDRQGYDR